MRVAAVLLATHLAAVVCRSSAERYAEEEAAMIRMLTLNHRRLVSDTPLPIKPMPGDDSQQQSSLVASAADAYGYPTGASPWATAFAESEWSATSAPLQSASQLDALFTGTSRALQQGHFAIARQRLQDACVEGQQLSERWAAQPASGRLGADGRAEGSAKDVAVVRSWVGDCTTLLQYMPLQPPVREDHKRLLMLLHDLGGLALVLHLLGYMPRALLRIEPLAELAQSIVEFGESNRKTALSRALGAALASSSPSAQLEGVGLLRDHSLCDVPGEALAAATPEDDLWSQAGVRVCATLLLRGRQVGEAVQLLKRASMRAPSLHAFLNAFELSSRLPPPPPSSPASPPSPPPPQRFSTEHMLEVLEAALEAPQHGLASEGNLLRWQLRSMLHFGHTQPALAPPLACPPLASQPLLRSPRVVIVMPFVASERERLSANLRSWHEGGGREPCAPKKGASTNKGASTPAVDLILYAAGHPSDAELAWLAQAEERLLDSSARCFGRVTVRHANLSQAEQYYIGGWDNTGPNNLFYSAFLDGRLHDEYDAMLWMETDMVPVQPRWLTRLVEEASTPRTYWRKGPAQQPELAHGMVSTHHYHMNSAGLYRLGQPCFYELMRRVAAEHPKQPHDVSTHLFLHDPRHFHIWQAHAHRFLYTDLVQNRLDEWSLDAVRALSPDTVFVHGKHQKPPSQQAGGQS